MANIGTALEQRAVAFAGLTALIGTAPTKFSPVYAGQGWLLPYVTYAVVADPPEHTMGSDKESRARVQIDCWASSYANAAALRDQVVACFDRLSGAFGGTTITKAICESRGLTVEPDEPSMTPRLTVEFSIVYLT